MNKLKDIYWDIVAMLSGVLMTLSFSPFNYWLLAIIGLALLFLSWKETTVKRALLRGYLFGLSLFGLGVSWVYISVHDFGGASVVVSILLTLLFVGFWSLFPALAGYFSVKFFQTNNELIYIVSLPSVWILIEYLRGSWVFNGFPWFQAAYSHLDTPLAGYIPILGAYGSGWLAVITSSILASIISLLGRNKKILFPLGIVICIWLGGWFLNKIKWTLVIGNSIRVTMIQGNVPQDKKWQPEYREKILQTYRDITYQHWDSQLIIWPESAVPAYLHQVNEKLLLPLEQDARINRTDLIISLPIKAVSAEKYNAVITLGSERGIYRKIHLLPFGEYMPLQPFSGYILQSLDILPLGSFTPGDSDQSLLKAGGYPFIVSICYEDAFGEESIQKLSEAAYLVNVTNDGWFGNSLEPYQHMQIARMRALEAGRYLLRSTNNGVTAFVAPNGKIIDQAPLFTTTAITGDIYPMGGLTPYSKLGDKPALIVVCLILLSIVFFAKIESR